LHSKTFVNLLFAPLNKPIKSIFCSSFLLVNNQPLQHSKMQIHQFMQKLIISIILSI